MATQPCVFKGISCLHFERCWYSFDTLIWSYFQICYKVNNVFGGMLNVTVITVENELGKQSSNSGQGCWHFISY